MTQEDFCQELMELDVARIDFVKRSGLSVGVPFGVPNLAEVSVGEPTSGSVLLKVGLSATHTWNAEQVDMDATFRDAVQHKVTEGRESAGIVRTHTVQIPIEHGFQTVRKNEKDLQQGDFYIIIYTMDGTRYLAYTLPNTSQFAVEEQMGSSATMTVKATVKSMSGLVRIGDGISTSS